MATKTTFLELVLPANNEFFNTWDTVVNENFVKVENKVNEHNTEIINARFTLGTLAEFLEVSHNPDGTLIATGETVEARNSRIYGHKDADGEYTLEKRIRLNDFENYYARRGMATIQDSFSLKQENLILAGDKTGLGQPNWLGFTGDKARLDGSGTQLDLLVSGKYQRLRALEEIEISGAADTYYLYAEYASAGEIKVDGDSTVAPPASANGVTGSDTNSDVRIFEDSNTDFTTFDVKAGDILRILGNTAVSGDFVIEEVAAEANPNYLLIKGLFADSLASLDYVVIDSYKPVLGFAADDTPTANRLYLGEVDFDGGAITASRPRQFKSTYVGDWRAVDLSGATNDFQEIFNHFLGDTNLSVSVQVSTANDGTAPIEHLSLNGNTPVVYTPDNGTLAINDTHALTAGDQTITGSISLQGTVGGAVDGGAEVRSVRMKYDKNQIFVKNLVSDVFYTDYDAAVVQTGFIRVIVQRKEG